jgi:hypothetical protein
VAARGMRRQEVGSESALRCPGSEWVSSTQRWRSL